jgi:hypothetical protein
MRNCSVVVLAVLMGCPAEPDVDTDTADEDTLEPVCGDTTLWTPGTTAYADASEAWGLVDILPTGVRIDAVDFDADGWTDLAVRSGTGGDDFSDGGARSTWLLRNTGAGQFEDITEASGITRGRDGTNGAVTGPVWVFGDVDGDGDLDVYTGLPDADGALSETSELRLNNGDGTFSLGPDSDLRVGAGDMPYGAAFTDVDRDGHLDLWIGQYAVGGAPQQDRLYSGDGEGGFTDITAAAGLTTRAWSQVSDLNAARAHTNAWSAAACDLDDDGAPELLAASYGRAPNHLWLNDGVGGFANHSLASGYAFDARTDWSDNESARCWCKFHPTDAGCDGVPAPELIVCNSDADAFRWNHAYDREAFRLGGNSGATVCRDGRQRRAGRLADHRDRALGRRRQLGPERAVAQHGRGGVLAAGQRGHRAGPRASGGRLERRRHHGQRVGLRQRWLGRPLYREQ